MNTLNWIPRYVVTKAPHVSGQQIPADEPCLVIRAQDVLAPAILHDYIRRALEIGVNPDIIDMLYAHLAHLNRWRDDNPSRIKLPDR